MAMKKKFLALAMAAAVALPASSVYAAEGYETKEWDADQEYNHSVTVTGSVANADGQAPVGRLQVELPTAMAFTVDKNGDFKAGNYTVKNNSVDGIVLSVDKFTENNDGGGINIVKSSEIIDSSTRDQVSITLNGKVENKNKALDLAALEEESDKTILEVGAKGTETLVLSGKAGTKPIVGDGETNGIKEDFTLVFKIKKDTL